MVSFVRAEDCDADIFVEIQNKSFKEDYLRYGECPGYGRTLKSMLVSMKKNIQYKIMSDDIPVGKISAHEESDTCHLDCLCVIPQYENQGIGQKAVKFIESQFPNAKSWYLETPSDKKRNHYFYIKCGYEITDEKMDGNVKVVIFSKTMNK